MIIDHIIDIVTENGTTSVCRCLQLRYVSIIDNANRTEKTSKPKGGR